MVILPVYYMYIGNYYNVKTKYSCELIYFLQIVKEFNVNIYVFHK